MIWITLTSVMILEGLRAFPVYNELANGKWDSVWELTIPAMMFIYIAGCIGLYRVPQLKIPFLQKIYVGLH